MWGAGDISSSHIDISNIKSAKFDFDAPKALSGVTVVVNNALCSDAFTLDVVGAVSNSRFVLNGVATTASTATAGLFQLTAAAGVGNSFVRIGNTSIGGPLKFSATGLNNTNVTIADSVVKGGGSASTLNTATFSSPFEILGVMGNHFRLLFTKCNMTNSFLSVKSSASFNALAEIEKTNISTALTNTPLALTGSWTADSKFSVRDVFLSTSGSGAGFSSGISAHISMINTYIRVGTGAGISITSIVKSIEMIGNDILTTGTSGGLVSFAADKTIASLVIANNKFVAPPSTHRTGRHKPCYPPPIRFL